NQGLDEAARLRRRVALHDTYHAALDARLSEELRRDRVPVLVSIHSFTPVMAGFRRPWHIGVMWDDDPRLSVPLIEALARDPDLVVGDNEPYSGRLATGYTVARHGAGRGLPHTAI